MKKKIYIISIILLMIIGSMAGCAKESDTTEEISMKIKEGSLTNISATVVITDLSVDHETNVYGEWFEIQRLEERGWAEAEVIAEYGYGFRDLGYSVRDNILEMDTEWEWLYGALPPGTYRIVKEVQGEGGIRIKDLYAEFTLQQ
jgi:hypothetical protein